MITKNEIIEWHNPVGKPTRERILHIFSDGRIALIDLNEKRAMPTISQFKIIEEDIKSGKAKLIENELIEEKRVSDDFLRRRDKNWEKIKTIAENPEVAFNTSHRWQSIKELEKRGYARKVVFELLRKYWQRG